MTVTSMAGRSALRARFTKPDLIREELKQELRARGRGCTLDEGGLDEPFGIRVLEA